MTLPVHPLFCKKPAAQSSSSGSLRWLRPLGPSRSCLHAVNLDPESSTKVAAFDLDGTVITKLPFNSPALEWYWWNAVVPAKLKEAASNGCVFS